MTQNIADFNLVTQSNALLFSLRSNIANQAHTQPAQVALSCDSGPLSPSHDRDPLFVLGLSQPSISINFKILLDPVVPYMAPVKPFPEGEQHLPGVMLASNAELLALVEGLAELSCPRIRPQARSLLSKYRKETM